MDEKPVERRIVEAVAGAMGIDHGGAQYMDNVHKAYEAVKKTRDTYIERLEAILAAEMGIKGLDGWKYLGQWGKSAQDDVYIKVARHWEVRWSWVFYGRFLESEYNGSANTALEAMEDAEAAWAKYKRIGDT